MARAIFHGPKHFRAIEVQLYVNCRVGNPLLGTMANSEDPCGISLGSALFALLKPIIKTVNTIGKSLT